MSTNPNPRTQYRTRTTEQPTVEDRPAPASVTRAPSMFSPTDDSEMPDLFDTEAEYTER